MNLRHQNTASKVRRIDAGVWPQQTHTVLDAIDYTGMTELEDYTNFTDMRKSTARKTSGKSRGPYSQ